MAFQVRVRARFEAAHHLTSYRGSPEPVHGHSWQVEACVFAPGLDTEGMAVDFVTAQAALQQLAAALDHRDLNTLPPFDQTSPTAERVAVWFFDCLTERLAGAAGDLVEITVWESPGCSVSYRP